MTAQTQTSLIPLDQEQLLQTWNDLSPGRKIALISLTVAAIVGLVFFIMWARTPDYTPAFTDLNATDGAAVVAYLQENNIPYRISENGTAVLVPNNQVHDIRLALAAEGLPGQGTVGFELFDTVNLGMTDFMQQVNYQRAMEGELARTIGTLDAVRSARVHVVIPQPTLFAEDEKPTTASVAVDLETGQKLSREQVQAIGHLVSSAVEGLSPENLTIVDMDGNILSDGSGSGLDSPVLSTTQLEMQRTIENDLENRIDTMIENVLGPDRAVVRVSALLDWDQVNTESETYLPAEEGSVIRSSRWITEASTATDAAAGVPGVDTNVPDDAATYQEVDGAGAGSAYTRSDLTTNYEVSRNVAYVKRSVGDVSRLSVSVLVDGITDTLTLDTIQNAVIAAAGLNLERGDSISLSTIDFDRTFMEDQEADMAAAQRLQFYLQLAQWIAVAVVLIVLFFAVRGMRRKVPQGELVDARNELLQEVDRRSDSDEIDIENLSYENLQALDTPEFKLDPAQQAAAERAQMLRQLQLVAKNRPHDIAQIIQFWLSEDDRKS